jgi:hypothetical protein
VGDRAGAPGVVLLGHELWPWRFGGDAGVVGRSVRVNGAPCTVIGVMPRGFKFPEFSDLSLPAAADGGGEPSHRRSFGSLARRSPELPPTG